MNRVGVLARGGVWVRSILAESLFFGQILGLTLSISACGVTGEATSFPPTSVASEASGATASSPAATDLAGDANGTAGTQNDLVPEAANASGANANSAPAPAPGAKSPDEPYIVLKCFGCGAGAAAADANLAVGTEIVPSGPKTAEPMRLSYYQSHLVTSNGLCLAASDLDGDKVTLQRCSNPNVLEVTWSPAMGSARTSGSAQRSTDGKKSVFGLMVKSCADFDSSNPNCYLRHTSQVQRYDFSFEQKGSTGPKQMIRIHRVGAPRVCLTDNGGPTPVAAACSVDEPGQLWTLSTNTPYDGYLRSARNNFLMVDTSQVPAALVISKERTVNTPVWWYTAGYLFGRSYLSEGEAKYFMIDVDANTGAPKATLFQSSIPIRPQDAPWTLGSFVPVP